jgi:hypothetical protein
MVSPVPVSADIDIQGQSPADMTKIIHNEYKLPFIT